MIPYADVSRTEMRVVTSKDGGQTFGMPRTIAKVVDNEDPTSMDPWSVVDSLLLLRTTSSVFGEAHAHGRGSNSA